MTARRFGLLMAVTLFALGGVRTPAAFASGGAWWRLSARAAPTNLEPGGHGLIELTADDIGSVGVSGATTAITLTDVLPQGLVVSEPTAVKAHRSYEAEHEATHWSCTVTEDRRVNCSTAWAIPAYEPLLLEIPVTVDEPAGTDTTMGDLFSVSGGEAQDGSVLPGASLERPLRVSDQPVTFGVEEGGYAITPEEAGGGVDARAGSHPYQLTSTLDFNQTLEEVQGPHAEKAVYAPGAPALPQNLGFQLPPGLLGNITASERCTLLEFSTQHLSDNLCPPGSAVGVATVTLLEPNRLGYLTFPVPLFNLEPGRGEPARFGFDASEVPVILDTSLRTSGDYGVTVSVNDATEAAQVLGAQITFWGTPGAQSHDRSRGWACLREEAENNTGKPCEPPTTRIETPLLSLPTSCTGELLTEMAGDSWAEQPIEARAPIGGPLGEPIQALEHCPSLPFEPAIVAEPVEAQEDNSGETVHSASTSSGLDVRVELPQAGTLTPEGLSEADVKDATVTLPPGVTLNPSAANGLQACSEQQIGYEGAASEPDPLEPGAVQPLRFSEAPAGCPAASRLGSVQIKTPLLAETLSGSVYLAEPAPNAEQGKNPFDSLIALYITAESETLGLHVKLAGEGSLDPGTGQITTTFTNTPQVPFEQLSVHLQGGPRGSITTPARCQPYPTEGLFTPWSQPETEQTPYPAQSHPEYPGEEFQITSGPDGGPCPTGSLPFAPTFQAGSTSGQAGAFTNFSLQLTNPDGDQPLSGLTMHLPAGIAALLAHVTPCPEQQASLNQCGPESLIGTSLASAGVGPDPVQLPGNVYLTGPYEDAPYGLAVVTPAVAGPFNLGDVTVRSRIDVDPHTAQVTITSDPFPTFVKGVPVDLKQISVQVNRPDFEYNPTNCSPMSIAATLTGSEGTSANVSSPFQVSGCQTLPFKLGVTATTQGKTSKADGASLGLTFRSKTGEAHVAKTILTIPATLPARLTTIQKACVASVFEANPASCPAGSDIGTAIVHTPVLKNPLVGPIYLVSHGNAAWPDAELVLQGEGIEVILDGQTAIKKGVTTSSFESVPDAPFESVEATLPEGPHSALTTNLPLKDHYSLCGQHLTIPTALTGQNGTAVTETVKVSVQGCAAVKASKAKKLTRAQKLAKAFKTCRTPHKRSRAERAACERAARKRYGARAKRGRA